MDHPAPSPRSRAGAALRLALLALLILFEGGVAVLMLRPQVDPQFRGYFIDRSTDCWPVAASGHYLLGTQVSFVKPASPGSGELKVCGWTDADQSGTWSLGNDARLRFRLGLVARDVFVALDLLPFTAATLPEQRVDIAVNGTPLESLRLGPLSTGTKLFRIPREAVLANWGRIDLRFSLPDAKSPLATGVNSDRRRLAIRLLSARLSLAR